MFGPQDVSRFLLFRFAVVVHSSVCRIVYVSLFDEPFLMRFPAQVDGGTGAGPGRVVEPQLDGTAGGGQDMQTNAAKAQKRRQPKD